jgi:hypothetical protein
MIQSDNCEMGCSRMYPKVSGLAACLVRELQFASITFCISSQRVFDVVTVYFVIDSIRKLLDTPSYKAYRKRMSKVEVTGEKIGPTVAHACRKRRLKWVLPRLGVIAQGYQLCKKFNRYRNLNNCKVVEALCSSGNEQD